MLERRSECAAVDKQGSTKVPKNDSPIRPLEFRLHIAIPFICLFVVLMVGLAVLWAESRATGRLPKHLSQNVDI